MFANKCAITLRESHLHVNWEWGFAATMGFMGGGLFKFYLYHKKGVACSAFFVFAQQFADLGFKIGTSPRFMRAYVAGVGLAILTKDRQWFRIWSRL